MLLATAMMMMIAVTSCSGVPSGVIPPEKMARLLADIHIGEAVADQQASTFYNDSTKQLLKQSIYERNGVDTRQVDSSLAWYGRNLDRYAEVYEKTVAILEEDLRKQTEAAASNMEVRTIVAFEAEGDSVDIWPLYRSRIFTPMMATDRITFEIKSDRYWEQGDTYQLRFKAVNPKHNFLTSVGADYTDGHTSYTSATPMGEGWHALTLRLDRDRNASVLYGYIAYPADSLLDRFPTVPAMVDSIQLVRLRSGSQSAMPDEGTQRELSAR